MKKIAISIPVHQCAPCVENQIQNIQKFVPNSIVILHVSASSPGLHEQIDTFKQKYNGFLFINPTRYNTYDPNEAACVTGLSTVHASNIKYISSIIQFDTIALETSNDMFVRKGIENTFENFDCGCGGTSKCIPELFPFKGTMEIIGKVVQCKTAEKAPQEGLWFPKDVATFVSDKVFELMSLLQINTLAGEEGVIANLMFNGFPELYDSNCESHYVYHDPSEGGSVATHMIHKVRNGGLPHVYAVKRVPRDINSECRKYINRLVQND